MKYALIGCGRISANHIKATIENHLNIVALCDLSIEKPKRLLEQFDLPGSTHIYTDYKEMLQAEEPDLVAIATESGKHAKIALECIEAGCHLIVEKPIALSLRDADAIIAKAKEKRVLVCTCHQNRFNKSIQLLRKQIEAGSFGKLLYGTAQIRWNRNETYYQQAPWRGTWEQDGGALMNQCIHNIDLLRWMMGNEIMEVTGITDNLKHPYIEAEDFGTALLKFKNGSYGIIEGTVSVYPENLEESLAIFGEKGTVIVTGKSVNQISVWQFAGETMGLKEVTEKYNENPPTVYGYGHSPLYADVIDAIENNRPPYVTAEDGRRALELVLAIYQSASLGKSVKLPLEEGSTINYKGRFAI
jgi:UDP-N-acetyl-2-amino-2-deoxyglucuronate dehydrogenase